MLAQIKTWGNSQAVRLPREILKEADLNIEKVSKTWTDNTFYDMMISCGISKIKAMLIRFGVFFNLNWYLKTGKKSILEYNIYKEDIGLVNGL